MKGKSAFAIVIVVFALAILAGCGGDNAEKQSGTSIDLLPMQQHVKKLVNSGRFKLSAMNNYYLYSGCRRALKMDGVATTIVWDKQAVLRYNIFDVQPRWLYFTGYSKGEFGGPEYNEAIVTVKGEELARIEFNGEEKEYRIAIPESLQDVGDNMITLTFSVLEDNPNWLQPGHRQDLYRHPYIAAYLGNLTTYYGPDEDTAFAQTANEEMEDFLYLEENGFLQQTVNSALQYAMPIHKEAKLAIEGQLQSQTGEDEKLTLSLMTRTDDDLQYKTLWSEEVELSSGSQTQSFKADIDLSDYANMVTELKIAVDSDLPFSETKAFWKKMKLSFKTEPESDESEREPIIADEAIKNVVYIVLDAARPDYFGAYGHDAGLTPNIDKLAEESLIFDNASVSAPYTIASVSTLFSGLLPEAHGVRNVTQVFPEDLENMPSAFTKSGWTTIAFAGTQFIEPHYQLSSGAEHVIQLRKESYKAEDISAIDEEAMVQGIEIAAKANGEGKNSFMYLHLLPPHWPYNPPGEFKGKFSAGLGEPDMKLAWQVFSALIHGQLNADSKDMQRYKRMYYDNLYYGDHLVKVILDALKERGMYENSLIIVTADHGEAMGEHNYFGHNETAFETMINIPMIIKVPGMEHKIIHQQIGWIDMFPTFSEMFQLTHDPVSFQGRSIAPILTGGIMEPKDYYYSRATGPAMFWGLRGETMKYMIHGPDEYIINHQEDPQELNNLIKEYPVLALSLKQRGLMTIAHNEAIASGEQEVELTDEDREDLKNLGYLQ